jgi:8-oxo-dGTP diphosphatase
VNAFGTATPYLAAYVILKKDGKIAFVKRANTGWMNGYYGLPAGKSEIEEACKKTAVREAKEEVGVVINEQDLKPLLTVHRLNKGDYAPEWIDIFFEASKWDGEVINAEPEVHSEVAWLDPKKLPENVIPSVKASLEAIERGETYLEYGW